jgi:hypothetical protein
MKFNITGIREIKLFRIILNFILHKKRPALFQKRAFYLYQVIFILASF